MFRHQPKLKADHWEDLIPRPVLAIFVAFGVQSPLRLLPMSDFLRTEFKLTLPQLMLQDQSAKWVLSVEDDSNNRFEDINLLAPLDYGAAVKLVLQNAINGEVQDIQFAPLSTMVDVGRLDRCKRGPSYSTLKVSPKPFNISY
jgi:hypothetical protein